MLLRNVYYKSWRAPIIAGAAVAVVSSIMGLDTAEAGDILFRGNSSLFSTEAVALPDDELANSRAMGVDSSPSLDIGTQQRLSVILWDDLKRQRRQGAGDVVGNIIISVTTAQ